MRGGRLGQLDAVDVLLLGAASSFVPLGLIASNYAGINHMERILGLIVGVWVLSVVLTMAFISLAGTHPTATVHTVFIAVVLSSTGGVLHRSFGVGLGYAALLGLVVLSAVLFFRLGTSPLARALVVGTAVALLSGPLLTVVGASDEPDGQQIRKSATLQVSLLESPDIFLIVTDGYPGAVALRQDFGSHNEELTAELTKRGFEVPSSVWASYWTTHISVASILDLGYPLVESLEGKRTRQRLFDVVGGENSLVATLAANGYSTHMIESGWSGGGCDRDHYDSCVAAPFFDEAMVLILRDSVARPYIARVGSAFTEGARRTMEWLLDNGDALSQSDAPEFVFAHLVAPHPPFFLNSDCDVVIAGERSGLAFNLDGVSTSVRDRYFLEQTACIDRFMIELAGLIEPDDVLIFVADHGTDRRSQLEKTGDQWSVEATIERMNVLAAVRVGDGCSVGDNFVTPNLMRRILNCYSSSDVKELPSRMWINGMIEVGRGDVVDLLFGRFVQAG